MGWLDFTREQTAIQVLQCLEVILDIPGKRRRAVVYSSSMTPVMLVSPVLEYATVESIAVMYAMSSLE